MSPSNTPVASRTIIDDLFGREMTREIWTGNYEKALPLSIQGFDLSAVLPAVFYMFRFGQRRGKGNFLQTFGGESGTRRELKQLATVEKISKRLASTPYFEGFNSEIGSSILGDMLLCFCLQNANRALGRTEQVQRVAPAHYMSSWVDLPASVAHLRYVPEMIVATLANQESEFIQPNQEGDSTWFAVGRGFESNVLLRAFHQGISRQGMWSDLTSDKFDESTSVGLDQLLMIRLAQQLGAAPGKLRGADGEKIVNQRPVAEKAAREFSEDIRRFIRSYATTVPRHGFVELLESSIAVGLFTILTSVVEILFAWGDSGVITQRVDQHPSAIFVDCSNGVNREIRGVAEQSTQDFMRRIERVPVILMALRLLDRAARYDSKIKALHIPTRPTSLDWLNLLGELLNDRREEAKAILYDCNNKAEQLAERIEAESQDCAQILRNTSNEPNPVWRLAEALTFLQGRGNTQVNLLKLVDSILLVGTPNGLGSKRAVSRSTRFTGTRKRTDLRSLAFSDSVLDYLVHLHVLSGGMRKGVRPLSLREFVHVLRIRYGFCIDQCPRGMTISNELLQANRSVLERRLRDLGLLSGVNDAESMKRLRPRFDPAAHERDEYGV